MRRNTTWLPFTALAALLASCSCAPSGPSDGTPTACTDGSKSEGEADVDCGGPCAPCADGKTCVVAADCASGVCNGVCAAPSCTDGVRNGDERAVDCGGPTCLACGSGVECTSGTQCASSVCLDGSCDCGDDSGVYVSATAGDDANPGTAAAPLQTIQAAVKCAVKVPREIRVAEGVYGGNRSDQILVVDGKSLVGGWSTGFAERSPTVHVSEILDTTDTGTNASGDGVRVASTTVTTVLDGFTIHATAIGTGMRASAISVAPLFDRPAGATIRKNVIHCGGNGGIGFARCIDLGTSGGHIVVEDNDVHLGASQEKSSGIQGDYVSSAEIRRNLLDGGSSATVVAIDLLVLPWASPIVDANDVSLGPGGDAGVRVQLWNPALGATPAIRNNVVVVTGAATGIDDGAAAEISNNTVVFETGTGIRTRLSGANIRNNAITTDSAGTCIEETSATAVVPEAVRNNDLWGCANLYLDEAGPPALSLDGVNALTGPAGNVASGNISADPTLDAASGYRPIAGSPLLGQGLDLSSLSLFDTDKTGATRTVPWTIGAYQTP